LAVQRWPPYVTFWPPVYATPEDQAETPEHEPEPPVGVEVGEEEVEVGGGGVVPLTGQESERTVLMSEAPALGNCQNMAP
jgi:hypothetical protein